MTALKDRLRGERRAGRYVILHWGQVIDEVSDPELEEAVYDSVVWGWCAACGAREDSCEPDARENYCAECEAQAVVSVVELLL